MPKPDWGVLLISPRGDADCVAFGDNICEVLFCFPLLGPAGAQWRFLKSAVTNNTQRFLFNPSWSLNKHIYIFTIVKEKTDQME